MKKKSMMMKCVLDHELYEIERYCLRTCESRKKWFLKVYAVHEPSFLVKVIYTVVGVCFLYPLDICSTDGEYRLF
jgi:hypothetical protein